MTINSLLSNMSFWFWHPR